MSASRFLVAAVAGLAAVWLLASSPFVVQENETALVTRFGRPLPGLAGPGLHWKLPWPVDAAVRFDRRLLIFDHEPTEMLTRDKKNVLVDSFLVWRIADPLRFVQTVKTRDEAEARLLDLTVSELGAAVGLEPMENLVNVDPAKVGLRRVAETAGHGVQSVALPSFGIEVMDLAINGFSLPRQNRASVIERMQAERARIATAYRSEGEEQALKIAAQSAAERERLLAEARGRSEAIRGGGEAQALALLSGAYAEDPQLYRFLRGLESSEKILDENTTLFLASDSDLLTVLDGKR
jgi:membrane protease subunit HflC